MDTTQAPSREEAGVATIETAIQQVDRINSALTAHATYVKDAYENSGIREVVQTPEAILGEKLLSAGKGIFETATTDFSVATQALVSKPEDDSEAKLIKLHQARELLRFPGVTTDPESAEKTLKVIETRPDLLDQPDIVKYLEDELYGSNPNSPRIQDRITENIKSTDTPDKLEPRFQKIMEKLASTNPDGQSAIYLGLAQGVEVANTNSRDFTNRLKELQELPNTIKIAHDKSPRARAALLGGALAAAHRTNEQLDENASKDGLRTAVTTELVKGIDALFPSITTGEMAKTTGPDAQMATIVESFAKAENGPIFKELRERNVAIIRAQSAEKARLALIQEAEEKANAAKIALLNEATTKLATEAKAAVEQQVPTKVTLAKNRSILDKIRGR